MDSMDLLSPVRSSVVPFESTVDLPPVTAEDIVVLDGSSESDGESTPTHEHAPAEARGELKSFRV